jgi:hypothetical protein
MNLSKTLPQVGQLVVAQGTTTRGQKVPPPGGSRGRGGWWHSTRDSQGRAGSWLLSKRQFLNEGGWGSSGPHIPSAATPSQPVLTCSQDVPDCPVPSSQNQIPESFRVQNPYNDHSLNAQKLTCPGTGDKGLPCQHTQTCTYVSTQTHTNAERPQPQDARTQQGGQSHSPSLLP